jgi:hypothetical protein
MKKLLVMVVAAISATMSVNAQVEDLRHEIGVTYGTGNVIFGDGIGNAFEAIFNSLRDVKADNEKQFGTLSLEYFYHLNDPKVAIGLIGAYSEESRDFMQSGTKVGDAKKTNFTIMPSAKYYWSNKEHFGFYSKVAFGATFHSESKSSDLESDNNDKNKVYFATQISPVGIEAGLKNLRVFLEGGWGEQGVIALIGLRTKF